MKTIKSLIDKINKSNAAYEKMTPAQKRVQIAKDVLLALSTRSLKATNMSYFYDGTGTVEKARHENPERSLKDMLPELPACNVCAKGAIFVCTVARQNNVNVGESEDVFCGNLGDSYNGDKSLSRALGNVFKPEQLKAIEDAFENFTGRYEHFYKKYRGSKQRMEAIMKNVIRGKGTFTIQPRTPRD